MVLKFLIAEARIEARIGGEGEGEGDALSS